MRIDLNARVRTRDGHDVGHITQVIFDPRKREVTGLVVATGTLLTGEDIVVPRADIERATMDGDVVVLQLTKDEFERLEKFVPERYEVAPVGWVPPPGGVAWGFPADAYLWALPLVDLPPHLEKGTPVVDRHGDEIGTVEDVEFEPDSGRIERFTVKVGGTLERLFGKAKEVALLPADVERIEAGEVRLSRDREDLVPS
jgi:sporulation protein YlmC with PRC-barrel domain